MLDIDIGRLYKGDSQGKTKGVKMAKRTNIEWSNEEQADIKAGKEQSGIKNTADFIRFLIKQFARKK